MARTSVAILSVVVPLYNENIGLPNFHKDLLAVLSGLKQLAYEVVYVDDGSLDGTAETVQRLHQQDKRVRLVSLSRNFGKEIALTAGVQAARGQAILTLDGDGQHPLQLIPEFVSRWQAGAKVVVGVRDKNQREGPVKRYGSKLFYRLLRRLTHKPVMPYTTDYRLIDQSVAREFLRLTERNRMTRAQIDWLGYRSDYVHFEATARRHGSAGYSFRKLLKLAIGTFISYSVSPLYFVAYVGAIVLPVSFIVGLIMIVNALVGDPLGWHATGSAYVIMLLLFLVGVLLVSQGIIGLYLSQIHTETQNRPLYVIDKENSRGL